ncbi:uncharacterized protein G2W53_008127 [Senna tora]|uniref:Uncharacterized protein n=1 Tax=Senna tora TaxID=362788 RepID=A0A834X7X8_9FABA|nr:uncharacterized protein G2W53_008127 [Senna tora]
MEKPRKARQAEKSPFLGMG